ncbi:MAG: PKD domain-containing protein [Methanoregula sp.]|jgi:PKD repeat protein|nr:PKD domain-containing protein [Methanoregula sp.]
MKQHLYLVMSLIVIAAIIPAASAAYNCSMIPSVDSYYGNQPWTITSGVTTQQQAIDMCNACGITSNAANINMLGFNSGDTWIWDSRADGVWQDRNLTDSSIRYVKRWIACKYGGFGTGNPVRVSDGACLGETQYPGTLWLNDFDILYHEPIILSECSAGTYPFRIVDFIGSPLTGPAPLSVSFLINNFTYVNASASSWFFGDGQTASSSTSMINHTYTNEGIYTVRMDYFNYSNIANSVQKNDYITAGAANATITTNAVARDWFTNFAIHGATISMQDIENSSWTNTTDSPNGEGSITTLVGHHLNIWGSAVGYDDDNLQNVIAVDGGYYSLMLMPANITAYNVSAGNLTLLVTVQDLAIPHNTIPDAEVTATWGAQYAAGISNAAGAVSFTVPNHTSVYLSVFKSGYASGSKAYITGDANGGSTTEQTIVYLGTDYVTPIITPTWTGTGTIPPTVDPYPCIGDGSAQDTANCQRKQGGMAADLIKYGPQLVLFFIMLTFIGGAKMIGK